MEVLNQFFQIDTCFFSSEIEDFLKINPASFRFGGGELEGGEDVDFGEFSQSNEFKTVIDELFGSVVGALQDGLHLSGSNLESMLVLAKSGEGGQATEQRPAQEEGKERFHGKTFRKK